jgi:hypothetical protein
MLALFFLTLMMFDAVNLHMEFEGLCLPGLGLSRYTEMAGVVMEVIPRSIPMFVSHVASMVTVVCVESNDGYEKKQI